MSDLSEKNINEIFDEAINECSDMVTRICLLMLGNAIDAQDAYLSVFEKLFISLKKDKIPGDVKGWLARVAYNECKSMLRFSFKEKSISLDELTEPFKEQENIEFVEMLFSLPEGYRNILYLYYNEGYTTKEIAGIISKSEGAVRSRLKRARDRLKTVMTEYDKKGEPEDDKA